MIPPIVHRLRELLRVERLRRLLPVTVQGRDRLRTVLLLAGAVLAGYMVTCVAYPAPLMVRDQEVTRVLGLPVAEAQKFLEQQGFKVKLDGEEADPVVPAGHVSWQDPPPETILPRGALVRLTPSRGPAAVSVPDVIAFELNQARQVVTAAGLRVGDVDTVPSAIEAGIIVSTRPPSGSYREPGSAIVLVVSSGPADIRVPDLLGLRQEEARQRLEAAGLHVGVVTRRPDRRPPGSVVRQQPGAGVLSPHDGRVDLVISN